MRTLAELLQRSADFHDSAQRVPRQHREVVDQLIGAHPPVLHPRVSGQLDTADGVVRPGFDTAGVHAGIDHPAAQHHREHPGDDLLRIRDRLALAGRVIDHDELVGLRFGGHRFDVHPDDLPGQVEAVQVRRQRRGHIGNQGGLCEPHHHCGRQIVLVDEVPVQNRLRHSDLGGDLVHADVAAAPSDGLECAVYQLIAALHLVLVPAPLASVGLDRYGWGLLCHYRRDPFPSSS